jgi:hypothetical protein
MAFLRRRAGRASSIGPEARERGRTRGGRRSARGPGRRFPRATLAHGGVNREREFIGVRYLSMGAEPGERQALTDRRCHEDVPIIESLTSCQPRRERTDYGESERQY